MMELLASASTIGAMGDIVDGKEEEGAV